MKNFFKEVGKKIVEAFNPNKDKKIGMEKLLTNKRLLEDLTAYFKRELEIESAGQRMLYPMSFNVMMHPDDYEDRKQSLPYILPEVVSNFHAIIEDEKVYYPDYIPAAAYWHFQFSPCNLEEIQIKNTSHLVKKGAIIIYGTLFTDDIQKANTSVNRNVRVSLRLGDSLVNGNMNVNLDAIKVNLISEGRFQCEFDKTLSRDVESIKAKFDNICKAELSYTQSGNNYYFPMQDTLIHISGKNEMRSGRSFLKLENTNLKDSHVQIKYDTEEKRFKIAAFGLTKVNGRELNISEGGNIDWYDLANKSSIFINDEIKVEFKIKEN